MRAANHGAAPGLDGPDREKGGSGGPSSEEEEFGDFRHPALYTPGFRPPRPAATGPRAAPSRLLGRELALK
jgi:hypothetical protein